MKAALETTDLTNPQTIGDASSITSGAPGVAADKADVVTRFEAIESKLNMVLGTTVTCA